MDLHALRLRCREWLDDAVEPYLVTDEALARHLSEAEREAAVRARLIRDAVTVPAVAGTASYTLDSKVFWIDWASFAAIGNHHRQIQLTGIDFIQHEGLQHRDAGRPRFAVHDQTRRQIALYPAPASGGTLALTVYRLPSFDLEDDDDEPEIHEVHHDGLPAWACWRVFSDKDTELYDEAKASTALSEFVARFGDRCSASAMQRHAERRRITTRYGGIL